jgi:hypothetical protein
MMPTQLPSEAILANIPDRMREQDYADIGLLDPNGLDDVPDHFPFADHGRAADAVMERYVNRYLPRR